MEDIDICDRHTDLYSSVKCFLTVYNKQLQIEHIVLLAVYYIIDDVLLFVVRSVCVRV